MANNKLKKTESDNDRNLDDSRRNIKNLKKNSKINKKINKSTKDTNVKYINTDIIIKNPFNLKESSAEKHIPINALNDLKKMSEKNHLRELEEDRPKEDKPKKKTVRFNSVSQKSTEPYAEARKTEKQDENIKKLSKFPILLIFNFILITFNSG